jgi:uncharacterized DUF497 family protein
MNKFEWDEAKRQWTLAERGLDFIDAAMMFDGRRRTRPKSVS